MMASAAPVRDKPSDHHHQNRQQQQLRQQPVLKCPRCDSSNTKFCYYNNYSLSQPRHFCKSCKRYWTRGGTLRNVPVGGGCRKNKRSIIKSTPFTKPPLGVGGHTTSTTTSNPNLDHHNPNPLSGLLLSQQQNHKYPRFNNRVSDVSNISRYDIDLIQPAQMSSFGLGFSLSDSGVSNNHGGNHNSIHPIATTYPSMFSGGLTSSSLQQPESIMGFEQYGDGGGLVMNDVQIEGTKSNIVWNNSFNNGQNVNENDEIKGTDHQSSDPASFLWSLTGGDGGEWLDPTTTICSSLL